MKNLYCILHEEVVRAEEKQMFGHLWLLDVPDTFEVEVDFCEFPFGWATCPPPELDMDEYMDSVVEPDEDEMAAINAESVL